MIHFGKLQLQAWTYAFDQAKQGKTVRLGKHPTKGWIVKVCD